jgi:hypothetical protein
MSVRTAGIVDENLEAPEFLHNLLHHGLRLLGLAHIRHDGESAAPDVANGCGRSFERLGSAARNSHIGTALGQEQGRRATDAGAAARDDRDTACEIKPFEIHGSPFP